MRVSQINTHYLRTLQTSGVTCKDSAYSVLGILRKIWPFPFNIRLFAYILEFLSFFLNICFPMITMNLQFCCYLYDQESKLFCWTPALRFMETNGVEYFLQRLWQGRFEGSDYVGASFIIQILTMLSFNRSFIERILAATVEDSDEASQVMYSALYVDP